MQNCLRVYPDTQIYVISIRDVTGGPDALHQMAYYLKKLGYNVKMAYLYTQNKDDVQAPEAYKCYGIDGVRVDDIIDDKHNIIIIPETFTYYVPVFRKAQKCVWWLSVDNYLNKIGKIDFAFRKDFAWHHRCFGALFRYKLKNPKVLNACASYYAKDFLADHGVDCQLMIEPLGLTFIDFMKKHKASDVTAKRDVVFYNPKKGKEVTDRIIQSCPDIEFIPIQGMTYQQVLETLQTGKVYMDFGEFPGAERLPKEAVISGCCIITGTKGASKNKFDVCIPEKYKYKDPLSNIVEIHNQILDFYKEYEKYREDFKAYVDRVNNLESEFEKSIKRVFERV